MLRNRSLSRRNFASSPSLHAICCSVRSLTTQIRNIEFSPFSENYSDNSTLFEEKLDDKTRFSGPLVQASLDGRKFFVFNDADYYKIPGLESVNGNKARKFKDLYARTQAIFREKLEAEVALENDTASEKQRATNPVTGQSMYFYQRAICSYGGAQSNAMLALARIASAAQMPFYYFTLKNERTNWLRMKPTGNYAEALNLGMKVIGLNQEQYDIMAQSKLTEEFPQSSGLRNLFVEKSGGIDYQQVIFVPQGGNFLSAASGVHNFVDDLVSQDMLQGLRCRLIIASGTGAFAYHAHQRVQQINRTNQRTDLVPSLLQNSPAEIVEVVAVPCASRYSGTVDSMNNMNAEFYRTIARAEEVGTVVAGDDNNIIISSSSSSIPRVVGGDKIWSYSEQTGTGKFKSHHRLGSLNPQHLEVWQTMQRQGIHIDLVYSPHALQTMVENESLWEPSSLENPIVNIYYNCGGTEGNDSMLARYSRKGYLKDWGGGKSIGEVPIDPNLYPRHVMRIIGKKGENIREIQKLVHGHCTIRYDKDYHNGVVIGGRFIISAQSLSSQLHASGLLGYAIRRNLGYQERVKKGSLNEATTDPPLPYYNMCKLHLQFLYFKASDVYQRAHFPANLAKFERRFLHSLSKEHGFHSSSTDKGCGRFVTIDKTVPIVSGAMNTSAQSDTTDTSIPDSKIYYADSPDFYVDPDTIHPRDFKSSLEEQYFKLHKKKVDLHSYLAESPTDDKRDHPDHLIHLDTLTSIQSLTENQLIPPKIHAEFYAPNGNKRLNELYRNIPQYGDDEALDLWVIKFIAVFLKEIGQSARGSDLGKVLSKYRLVRPGDPAGPPKPLSRKTYSVLTNIKERHGNLRRFLVFCAPKYLRLVHHDTRSYHICLEPEEL